MKKNTHSYLESVLGTEVLSGWIWGIVLALLWYLMCFLREEGVL